MSGKFYAHDAQAMADLDRQCDDEADARDAEVRKLERLMHSDFNGYMRSGGSDRLLQLKTGGE